jgi:hypothetical protein
MTLFEPVALAVLYDRGIDGARRRCLMRFRLLLSLPISLLLVAIILVSAAKLVTAVEGGIDGGDGLDAPLDARVPAVRAPESHCDVLRREIHALSHEVVITREYERLRDALHDHCGLPRSLVDFAWEVGAQMDLAETCEFAHDGFEAAARGESRPTSYSLRRSLRVREK